MKFMILPVDVLELPPWWREVKHRLKSVEDELRFSIMDNGFVHPIIVLRTPDNRFFVVDGVTRYMLAEELGIHELPCMVEEVKELDDLSAFKKAVLFNMAQSNLGIISKLKIVRFLATNGVSIVDACKLIGRSEQWFRKYRALLELAKETQDMIERGEITVSEVIRAKDFEGGYRPLPGSDSYPVRKSFRRKKRKEAPRCEICDKPIRSDDRKWVPMHRACWDMLNDLLHEVLIFSREENKIMFFCRRCKQMIGRADYSSGKWVVQRALGEGER